MRRTWLIFLVVVSLACLALPSRTSAQLIQTAAGNGVYGYGGDNGPAASAAINYVIGVAVDSAGNLYIADNERIRVVNTGASAITVATVLIQPGDIATVAGNGLGGFSGDGGPATSAEFNNPVGVAVDNSGNIYIADRSNARVRMVNTSGIISTVAGNGTVGEGGDGGPATDANFDPYVVAVDSRGILYISDVSNLRIRAVNRGASAITVGAVAIQPGNIATVAGNGMQGSSGDNGPATSAELYYPYGLAVDSNSNIYICDTYNREIRVVNTGIKAITVAQVAIQPGNIATIAGNNNYGNRGDGYLATTAEFADPDGVSVDSHGNIYVSDSENERVRMVNTSSGIITTIAGNGNYGYNGDGIPATTAWLTYPRTTAVDNLGNVYIADQYNLRVRKIAVNPGAPSFTSRNSTAFTVGTLGTFTITTTDLPVSSLSESGTLPNGIRFFDNGNGTATLTGTPTSTMSSPFVITFTASNGVLPQAMQTFTLTVYPLGGGAMATFVRQDTTTEGDWQGVYGADGYSLANITPQNIPGYASFAPQNQQNYTWSPTTTDPRALQMPGSATGMAATWYLNASFTLDVNITDGNSHQFALYAIDWDHLGRSETIQIQDVNTGLTLDEESISNFGSGVYLVWNIAGHVQIIINPTSVPNGVVSGVFFGGAGILPVPILSIAKTHGGNFTQGQQNATYSVTVSNLPHAPPTSGTMTVTEMLPSGLSLVSMGGTGWVCGTNSCSRTDPLSGGLSYPAITVTVNVAANAASPQLNQVSVSGGGSLGINSASDLTTIAPGSPFAQASFVRSDTSTQGNWQGTYGTDGYYVANYAQSIPAYASFAPLSARNFTWAFGSISDPRALVADSTGDRIASALYSPVSFSLDLSTDGNLHQVAIYFLDWDNEGRAESIQVLDANFGTLLDSRSIPGSNTGTTGSSFVGGTYLVWNVSGHVTITITPTGGPNGVANAIFFGSATQTGPAFTSANTTTFTVGQPGTFTVSASGSPAPALTYTGTLPTGVGLVDNGNGTATLSGTPTTGANPTYNISLNATNSVSSLTQSFTLTVNSQVTVAGPPATFVKADTSTGGTWMGVYGSDGYDVENGPESPANGQLTYGTYAVQNQKNYVWAPSSSDKRALEIDSQGDRTAGAWYSSSSFSFDVNFTDGNTHQVALYVVDWDNQGRGETINVLDASNPNNPALDTRTIPNANTSTTSSSFFGGTYLVWNISGHVTITITRTSGPNGAVSGIFFGTAAQAGAAITSTTTATFTVGQPGTFTVTSSGLPIPSLTENGGLPSNVSFVDNGNGTGTLGGTPATGTNQTYDISFTATNAGATFTQNFTLTVNPQAVAGGGPTATFAKTDTTTGGNWMGVYGGDGYDIANGPQTPASGTLNYGTYSLLSQSEWTWAASTADSRALAIDTQDDRTAATWYSSSSFSFDVNFTDTNTHQVALYLVDWDNHGRGETINVLDASHPSTVLDTRSVPSSNTNTTGTNFVGGTYLVWNISGHVVIQVNNTGSPNAVVSGIFFATSGPTSPAFTSANSTTFTVGQSDTFLVTASGSPTPTLTATGTPNGINFTDNGNGTGTLSGPSTTNPGSYSIGFTASNGVSPDAGQSFTLNVASQFAGPTAAFLGYNTATQGNWVGTYGAQGYSIANASQTTPSYDAALNLQNLSNYTWAPTTTDVRALQNGSGRIAAAWYSPTNFSFDVNITDMNQHQFALYVTDWDSKGRAETIQIMDATSGLTLDTRTIPNSPNPASTDFVNGTYLIWNISGHLTIKITSTNGPNAVVSGIFFDQALPSHN